MGFPYSFLGPLLLVLVPTALRDWGYRIFARNRGTIWKGVKRVTGLGDTNLSAYRDRIVGLKEQEGGIPPSWGLDGGEEERNDQ